MINKSIVSPEDQRVTFVELFFDLVFVFSVTQVVGLLHDGLSWLAIGQAVLVFWLVWWAWTQFTWSLNAADTTNPRVDVIILTATGVVFFMAVALPGAFQERALWFAGAYVLVRAIGLILYGWVASSDPSQRRAVQVFSLFSLGGLAAVLLGAHLGGTLQIVFWGIAILLDVIAAAAGGQLEGWNLHPEHFTERHGLFVIIALGETLIVAAGQVAVRDWNAQILALGVLVVAMACGLWWSYFPRAQPVLEGALKSQTAAARTRMARDVFSLIHFPMLFGVIAFAAAVEGATAHPDEPLSLAGRLALAAALVLFVGGMAVAVWRATGRLLTTRLVLIGLTAIVLIALPAVSPVLTVAAALAGILAITVLEQRPGNPILDMYSDEG